MEKGKIRMRRVKSTWFHGQTDLLDFMLKDLRILQYCSYNVGTKEFDRDGKRREYPDLVFKGLYFRVPPSWRG